jgi:hypothetical protein
MPRLLFGAGRRKGGLQSRLVVRHCGTDTSRCIFKSGLQKRLARRPTLRSSLVYAASKGIPNRFQLCQTVNKATRKLHLPSTSTESTINRVLLELAQPPATEAPLLTSVIAA